MEIYVQAPGYNTYRFPPIYNIVMSIIILFVSISSFPFCLGAKLTQVNLECNKALGVTQPTPLSPPASLWTHNTVNTLAWNTIIIIGFTDSSSNYKHEPYITYLAAKQNYVLTTVMSTKYGIVTQSLVNQVFAIGTVFAASRSSKSQAASISPIITIDKINFV